MKDDGSMLIEQPIYLIKLNNLVLIILIKNLS